jgi:hypothetical protein
MLNYRPLIFFWIAEFQDGKALPQFDPKTGEENKFSLVDLPLVRQFGWYPFTPELSRKIYNKTGILTIPSDNPVYTVTLKKGDKLIAKRENIIKFNMKNEVTSRQTVYLLGKAGEKNLRIRENGSVE